MSKRILFLPVSLLLLAMAGCAASSDAQVEDELSGAGGWVLLGEQMLDVPRKRDEIRIRGHKDAVTEIQFRVRRRAFELLYVKLYFSDGGFQDITLRDVLQPGLPSRKIDIDGEDPRQIRSVQLEFRGSGRGAGRANLQLYGRAES